jgi:hypothetical protein
MKKIILLAQLLFIFLFGFAQTTVLSVEGFEGATNQFTSYAASNPVAVWNSNTVLSKTGTKSYRGVVTFNDTLFLESPVFSTMGYLNVNLSFSQICKIGSLDKGMIQFSINNGTTWTYLTGNEYLGTGLFSQNVFSSRSYPDWVTSQPTTIPNNTWWKDESFNISLTSNNSQVKIRFVLVDGDFNGPASNYGWLLDDFKVVGAVCELDPPVLSNATIITGSVYNTTPTNLSIDAVDASGIASAKVFYTLNGGLIDSISLVNGTGNTWTGSLPSAALNDTICYYYSFIDNSSCFNKTTLPSGQCYKYYIDPVPPVQCIGTPINSFPYNEAFTSFLVGTTGVLVNDWENATTDDFDWFVHTGNTPSTGTGPLTDHTGGNGKYLYIETSGQQSYAEAHLISPCFTLASATFYQLSFWYHMNGAAMGDLHIDVLSNNNWVLDAIPAIVGSQGNQWSMGRLDLSNYAGQTIKVRFRGVRGTNYTSDIALDDIKISVTSGEDVSIASVDNPINKSCLLSPLQDVQVTILNSGIVGISSIPVAYQLNNSAIVRATATATITPNGTHSYIFSQQVTVTPNMLNTIKVWTELSTDVNPSNDTSTYSFTMNSTVNTFPFVELFDSFTAGSPGTLINGWVNDDTDDIDWNVNSGGTPSANTGPSQDHNSTGSGNYMYIETSGITVGSEAFLISPCIDLTNVLSPELEFWYHMYGTNMGALHLDIWSNGAWVLDVMPIVSGNQGNVWKNQKINLSTYNNQIIKVRFRGDVGSGFMSDIAIDEVSVTNSAMVDVSLNTISSPVSRGCLTPLNQNVTVSVQNFGNVALSAIPIAYQNNNGIIYRDTITGNLAPFASRTFSFTQGVNLQASTNNNFVVWIESPLDLNASNDTLRQFVSTNGTVNVFPVTENFDAFVTGIPGTLLNGWENEAVNDSHDWYVNSGGTPTLLTGPTGDHTTGSGNYFWLQSDGNSGKSARLLSPCYDFGSLNSPQLSFWYNMFGADMGVLHLDLIINGFYIQDIIQPISGNKGQNWLNKIVNLSGYSGNVRLVFRGDVITKSGVIAGDMALDDIQMTDLPVGLATQQSSFYIGEVFPNPTAGTAHVMINTASDELLNLNIMDIKGQLMGRHQLKLNSGQQTIEMPVTSLEQGIYVLQFNSENKSFTRRLIVK